MLINKRCHICLCDFKLSKKNKLCCDSFICKECIQELFNNNYDKCPICKESLNTKENINHCNFNCNFNFNFNLSNIRVQLNILFAIIFYLFLIYFTGYFLTKNSDILLNLLFGLLFYTCLSIIISCVCIMF